MEGLLSVLAIRKWCDCVLCITLKYTTCISVVYTCMNNLSKIIHAYGYQCTTCAYQFSLLYCELYYNVSTNIIYAIDINFKQILCNAHIGVPRVGEGQMGHFSLGSQAVGVPPKILLSSLFNLQM